jgi:hypothetical protein
VLKVVDGDIEASKIMPERIPEEFILFNKSPAGNVPLVNCSKSVSQNNKFSCSLVTKIKKR